MHIPWCHNPTFDIYIYMYIWLLPGRFLRIIKFLVYYVFCHYIREMYHCFVATLAISAVDIPRDFSKTRRPLCRTSSGNREVNTLKWRYNERDGAMITSVSIICSTGAGQTPKLHITDFCEGNPLVTGGFPSQRASNAENVFIRWLDHGDDQFGSSI